ncbi:hypothetical protein CSC12_6393 (plasmid) [Klebsiella michiganensis]|nr:hypothetical protein CSC12_6393 [Klebsiella michiganensis]
MLLNIRRQKKVKESGPVVAFLNSAWHSIVLYRKGKNFRS